MTELLQSENYVILWFLISLGGLILASVVVLAFGSILPRNGDWLLATGWLGQIAVLLFGFSEIYSSGHSSLSWAQGWIWPKKEPESLKLGLLLDPIGLSVCLMCVLIAALITLNFKLTQDERKKERVFAAAGFSTCGLQIAWMALTPWLAFGGIALTILGGFLAFASQWHHEGDSKVAIRFLSERTWGLILAILGATALAAAGIQLNWGVTEAWRESVLAWVGAFALGMGLLVQLQPFPLLGWSVNRSEFRSVFRCLFTAMLPGWAAVVFFVRLAPSLENLGVGLFFGWAAVISAFLTSLTGLLQRDWKLGMNTWFSAAFTLGIAAIHFSGVPAGLALIAGATLAALSVSVLGAEAERESQADSQADDTRAGGGSSIWIKTSGLLAACAGSGMIGFVSCAGFLKWLTDSMSNIAVLAIFAFVLFFYFVLVWKQSWSVIRISSRAESIGWFNLATALLIPFLVMATPWTGSISGGAVPESVSSLTPAILQGKLSPLISSDTDVNESFIWASWVHWGMLLIAMVLAYWTSARRQSFWHRIHDMSPSFARFVSEGYGIDWLVAHSLRLLNWSAQKVQWTMDEMFWKTWAPSVLGRSLKSMGRAMAWFDRIVTIQLNEAVRKGTEVPAKMLQLIHSGNIQWYLFFAVGSGIAILLHSLRFN